PELPSCSRALPKIPARSLYARSFRWSPRSAPAGTLADSGTGEISRDVTAQICLDIPSVRFDDAHGFSSPFRGSEPHRHDDRENRSRVTGHWSPSLSEVAQHSVQAGDYPRQGLVVYFVRGVLTRV